MTGDRPRHSRKEIRSFADELDRGGWVFERVDSSGHTIWSHPKATGLYKLPETPRHWDTQRARRDVARLLGQRPSTGKRSGKAKPARQRQDFVLAQARRSTSVADRPGPALSGCEPIVHTPAPRRVVRRLPWEDQPDNYNHDLDQLMREPPGGRRG